MKEIKVFTIIQTILDVEDEFADELIPAGSLGTVVECYENPSCYAVDLAIPDKTLVGGTAYSNVILTPAQFLVLCDDKPLHSINGYHRFPHYGSTAELAGLDIRAVNQR